MGSKLHVSLLILFSFIACTVRAQSNVFDITKYGARADGASDISTALSNAWKAACAATGSSRVVIPKGTYLSGLVDLKGPCKGPIHLQVRGTVRAPTKRSQHTGGQHDGESWIAFIKLDRLTVSGGGIFDGQGETAWKENECHKSRHCKQLPISLRFDYVTNSIVEDITSLDSKNFHANVLESKNLTFRRFSVIAPAESINTDGIHIGRSSEINITDSNIRTGDDCISIGDDTTQVRVTNVRCGPGHGISVGSLGKYKNEGPVSGIYVRNCTIEGTDNGVRIKSWPALYGGVASNMHFEDIIMKNVGNPILIDQVYCPWNQCNAKIPSKVKISNVSFKNIKGTSATAVAVQLNCSSSLPCENVELADINLTYTGAEGPAKSLCANVKPKHTGKMIPAGC